MADNNPTTDMIAAALLVLASVSPATLKRKPSPGRSPAKRMEVSPEFMRGLAAAAERACPGTLDQVRASLRCQGCGKEAWQYKHTDDCAWREHDTYDADGRRVPAPGRTR